MKEVPFSMVLKIQFGSTIRGFYITKLLLSPVIQFSSAIFYSTA